MESVGLSVESVGIVLVSHSEQVACGLREMLREIVPGEPAVAAAGGTADGRLGTSDERIRAAIAAVDRGAGVVVLADLGSAVLTARAVLDELERADVTLVDAPLVEGAVAAGALAAAGADHATVVAAAAEAARIPKF